MKGCNYKVEFSPVEAIAIPAKCKWIRSMLPLKTTGAYLLVSKNVPFYTGRSDSCLLTRLCNHEYLDRASHIVWEVCNSDIRAYHQECYWYKKYHKNSDFLNRIEPARPKGDMLRSPFLLDAPDICLQYY